jgi:acetyltransferase
MSESLQISEEHQLRPLLLPRSVALVGATEHEGKLGQIVLRNLVEAGFTGELHLVNRRREKIGGMRCHRSLPAIGKPVDLAIITTPPDPIPEILEDAGRAGVKGAVILTAGFAELGAAGKERQAKVIEIARANGVRVLGPNCIGFMRPRLQLNASSIASAAKRGRLAVVSQSGAFCAALVDFAATTEIGFSTVISLGAAADVDFGEILDFLINDPETEGIVLYIEGIHDARRFMSSLRAASRTKPVIILKTGRHLSGSKAASSHSGALVGDDEVFSAALRRAGTVRVKTYTQLFAAARILAARRIPQGSRLAIVTNGGGPGVMAADSADANGVPLARLASETLKVLDAALPPHWSHGNPVDIVGDARADRFEAATRAVLADPNVDALVVMQVPMAGSTPEAAASAVVAAAKGSPKPVLTAWLGSVERATSHEIFEAASIPHFFTPENAVEAFSFMASYRRNQLLLLEVPPPLPQLDEPDLATAETLRRKLVAEGRTVMTEDESKALVRAFGLPAPETFVATTPEEALAAARRLGFPVALKILSPDIVHKSDHGGVRLNLRNGRMVVSAWRAMMAEVSRRRRDARITGAVVQKMIVMPRSREVLVGIATDPVFGPVVLFGAGGIAVEAIGDTAVMLPPLSRSLALDLIRQPRVHRVLEAFRDYPAADIEALVRILLQVSTLACALPWVQELDLNPVLVNDRGAAVVDARVVIDPAREAAPVRYRHMAIHPYPSQLESALTARGGEVLRVRPIRPEDARLEEAFVTSLSEQTRYMRFQHHLPRLTPQMLARFTQIDYDREMALIALEGEGESERIVCVARYVPNPNRVSAEFAITVADDWQGRGLGGAMMRRLLDVAREVGYSYLEGSVLTVNSGMLQLMTALGFRIEHSEDDPAVVRCIKDLA